MYTKWFRREELKRRNRVLENLVVDLITKKKNLPPYLIRSFMHSDTQYWVLSLENSGHNLSPRMLQYILILPFHLGLDFPSGLSLPFRDLRVCISKACTFLYFAMYRCCVIHYGFIRLQCRKVLLATLRMSRAQSHSSRAPDGVYIALWFLETNNHPPLVEVQGLSKVPRQRNIPSAFHAFISYILLPAVYTYQSEDRDRR